MPPLRLPQLHIWFQASAPICSVGEDGTVPPPLPQHSAHAVCQPPDERVHLPGMWGRDRVPHQSMHVCPLLHPHLMWGVRLPLLWCASHLRALHMCAPVCSFLCVLLTCTMCVMCASHVFALTHVPLIWHVLTQHVSCAVCGRLSMPLLWLRFSAWLGWPFLCERDYWLGGEAKSVLLSAWTQSVQVVWLDHF